MLLPQEDDTPLRDAKIEVIRADVCDPASLAKSVEDIRTVFHCASLAVSTSREAYFAVNVKGTENLLEACGKAGVKKFIFLSSTGVYGHGRHVNAKEIQPYAPDTGYSASNVEAEKLVFSYHKKGIFSGTVMRPRLVYGPGDQFVVPSIVRAIQKFPFLISGGQAVNDLVHMDDLMEAMVLAAENPASGGKAYHVTDGTTTTTAEQFFTIARHFGFKPPSKSLPYWLLYLIATGSELLARLKGKSPLITKIRVKMLGRHHHYSIERARHDLGFEPRVNLEEGLRRTWPNRQLNQ